MKRTLCLLLVLVLCLSMAPTVFADVIIEPEDSFFWDHRGECVRVERPYYADGPENVAEVYRSPESAAVVERVKNDDIQEVILALPTTMEGDTTNFYIYKRLQNLRVDNTTQHSSTLLNTPPLKISQIARGVAIGNEIEYTDEITLGRSIVNRIEFKL